MRYLFVQLIETPYQWENCYQLSSPNSLQGKRYMKVTSVYTANSRSILLLINNINKRKYSAPRAIFVCYWTVCINFIVPFWPPPSPTPPPSTLISTCTHSNFHIYSSTLHLLLPLPQPTLTFASTHSIFETLVKDISAYCLFQIYGKIWAVILDLFISSILLYWWISSLKLLSQWLLNKFHVHVYWLW